MNVCQLCCPTNGVALCWFADTRGDIFSERLLEGFVDGGMDPIGWRGKRVEPTQHCTVILLTLLVPGLLFLYKNEYKTCT